MVDVLCEIGPGEDSDGPYPPTPPPPRAHPRAGSTLSNRFDDASLTATHTTV